MTDNIWSTVAAISTARAEERRWDAKFDDLVRRARNGERNLECAGAMCVGAWKAARNIRVQLGENE